MPYEYERRGRRRLAGQAPGGGGGGGIDVGGLLMKALGGVEKNQNFGQVEGPPTADGMWPGGNDMFMPKTIFDRADASRMNAEYFADQISAENDMNRGLDAERQMNPILGDRERIVGGEKNNNTIDLRKRNRQLDLSDRSEDAPYHKQILDEATIREVLGRNDLTPGSFNQYNTAVEPEIIKRLIDSNQSNSQIARTQGTQARITEKTATATEPFDVPAATYDAQTRFQRAQSNNMLEDNYMRNAQHDADQYIRNQENAYTRGSLMPTQNGVYDIRTGQRVFGGDPMQDEMLKRMGINVGNGGIGTQGVQPQGDRVGFEVDGIKYVGKPTGQQQMGQPQQPIPQQAPQPQQQQLPPQLQRAIQPTPRPIEAMGGGRWVLENGQFVFKPTSSNKVVPIPR